MSGIRRRDFVILLGGGAAAARPLGARAQQAIPVIGFLSNVSPGEAMQNRLAAFRQGLAQAGYVEGRDVTIEYRWAEGRYDRVPELAADLVQRQVSAIAAPGNTNAALAAKAATQTIPIVFGVNQDPVKLGLVASLARPGGNATGINFFIGETLGKRLGLLRELVPAATRFAQLVNSANNAVTSATLADAEAAASALGLQVQTYKASTSREIDVAFAALVRERPDAPLCRPGRILH